MKDMVTLKIASGFVTAGLCSLGIASGFFDLLAQSQTLLPDVLTKQGPWGLFVLSLLYAVSSLWVELRTERKLCATERRDLENRLIARQDKQLEDLRSAIAADQGA